MDASIKSSMKICALPPAENAKFKSFSPDTSAEESLIVVGFGLKHLVDKKCKKVITLDESSTHLSYCSKTPAYYYQDKSAEVVEPLNREGAESLSFGFMIIAALSYRGKPNFVKVDTKVKINSKYYKEQVLMPMLEK